MVTMINRLTLTGDEGRFEKALDNVCAHMMSRPGFVGLRLHRSLRRPGQWVMVAQWTDAASHRAAATGPVVEPLLARLRAEALTEPDVYETVREA